MADKFPYEDIINMEPHISKKYKRPTMEERAARFAPFAAITGYEDMIMENARIVDRRIELDDDTKILLNEKIKTILKNKGDKREVKLLCFMPDLKKEGGRYVEVTGVVKNADYNKKEIIFEDGRKISIYDIYEIYD